MAVKQEISTEYIVWEILQNSHLLIKSAIEKKRIKDATIFETLITFAEFFKLTDLHQLIEVFHDIFLCVIRNKILTQDFNNFKLLINGRKKIKSIV